MEQQRLFLLPQISITLIWVEQFIISISSILLTFVAVVTVASALNGGQLLEQNVVLKQGYAWCSGIGVEGQLSGMAFVAMRHCRKGQIGTGIFFWVLTAILAFASIIAGGAVNYQESFKVPFDVALLHIGISQEMWVWVRVVVLIGLIVLSAALRYTEPLVVDVEQQVQALADQEKIATAKAKLQAVKLQAFAGVVRSGVAAATAGPAAAVPVATVLPSPITVAAPVTAGGDMAAVDPS